MPDYGRQECQPGAQDAADAKLDNDALPRDMPQMDHVDQVA
jgi:hypothetical protein